MSFKIGGYEIQREIGRGATGTVYLAHDPFRAREVAIKVAVQDAFRDPVNGPRLRKMFLNEAALAGRLRHPHIVEVFNAGTDEDFRYIVMEYVAGGTLEAHCAPAALLAFDKLAEIGFKCGQALDHAYRHGVIHRDIKPANILLAGATDIKVSDFGAALWHNTERTQVLGAVGSPMYMSPEQIRGEDLTHQTDIYSLGVMLYRLAAGRAPYVADNEHVLLRKIQHERPPPLRELRPQVPAELAAIIERAMEKDLSRRYAQWSEVIADLSELAGSHAPSDDSIVDSFKFSVLKKLGFFYGFADAELWEFLRISEWARMRAGRTLLEEGHLGQSFFLLASGTARVGKLQKQIGSLGAGDCFGETPYVYGERRARTATITADSDVVLVKVKPKALAQASEALQLRVNQALLRTFADRLSRTNALLASP
jgi:tRNA A-37 threonylcarbamoyl transferase component Bud32